MEYGEIKRKLNHAAWAIDGGEYAKADREIRRCVKGGATKVDLGHVLGSGRVAEMARWYKGVK